MIKLDKIKSFYEAVMSIENGEKGICEVLNSNTYISITPLVNGEYQLAVTPQFECGFVQSPYVDMNDALATFTNEFLKRDSRNN